MIERIILSVAGILMLLITVKKPGWFHKIITCILTIGVLVTWLNTPLIVFIGYIIFTFGAVLAIIYAFTQSHLSYPEKRLIFLTGLTVFIGHLFILQNWPFGNATNLLMAIPLIVLLFSHKKVNLKLEFGFMTILMLSCLLRLISLLFFKP